MTTDPEPTNIANRSGGADLNAQGDINVGGDVVGRDKTVYEAPAPIATSLHQLPPPPRDFTGRESELAELMTRAETDGVTISGLQGMGGVGKTVLALVLAERLEPHYPDAQFYLDLKGASKQPLSIAEALTHVIRAYHPTSKLPESQAELRGLYLSVLKNQRALILMDNAAGKSQVEPLIPPSSCFLLVTSRQQFALPGLFAKDLNTLPPNDARDLLLKIAPRIDGQADAMARLCGYLPLALRLAGSALAERHVLTSGEYLKRLEDTQARLELVDASLSLSYDLLTEELRLAWCILSVFPDTFDMAAAAAVWNVTQERAQDWLDALIRYSLVEWDATADRARLHDLARVFAAARLGDTERTDAQRRHAVYYADVIETATRLYDKGGHLLTQGLRLFDLERTNIETGQTWSVVHTTEDDEAAKSCNRYGGQWSILSLRLHPRECVRWIEAGLSAARRLGNRQAEGVHLGDLGSACSALGKHRRAIEYLEQALTIAQEVGDRRGEGQALGNLGRAYYSLGEYRRAMEYQKQRLSIAQEIGDRRGEGYALGNLGNAYHALSEYRRAIEYHERALTIGQEIGDRLGEGRALGNLGNAYYSLGEYRRAIEYYEQALTIAQEIGDRLGEGYALRNLGNAHHAVGEDRRAIEYYEQRLAIDQEVGYRRNEAKALGNLGNAYFSLKDYKRARAYYMQQRAIAKEIGDRPGEGNALWGLAICFEAEQDTPQAITHAQAALDIFTAIESSNAQIMRDLLAEWRQAKQ